MVADDAQQVARDIYRLRRIDPWPSAGAWAAYVDALEDVGLVVAVPRHDCRGVCAWAERGDDTAPWVIYLSSRLRGAARLEAVAHEVVEIHLAGECHDRLEADCDAVAWWLVRLRRPRGVLRGQLALALGASSRCATTAARSGAALGRTEARGKPGASACRNRRT